MTDIPKLTEAEADRIRWGKHSYQETKTYGIVHERLVRSGLLRNDGEITPNALAALAAYDAAERAKIRVEAMRECEEAVILQGRLYANAAKHGSEHVCVGIADDIRALIAKETP